MAKKKKGISPIIWIVGLLLIATALIVIFRKDNKAKAVRVVLEAAEKRQIVESVYASGKLFPATEVEITSNVSGTIVELLVEEGENVKEGQLLAKIDPEALASVVERASASAKSARAQLGNIKAQKDQLLVQLAQAKANYDRNKTLFDEGVISKAELETIETSFRSTEANIAALDESIRSAKFNVESADATVREQQKNLSQTSIYAPMAGVVSKLYKKQGEQVVGTIQMAGTPILKISNLSSIEVRVDVNERDILQLNRGDSADIELDAYPNRKFLGLVTHIANTATGLSTMALTSDQVTNFEVRILMSQESYKDLQLDPNKPPFRAGLSASAEIRTNSISNALSLPIAAVTSREDEQAEEQLKKGEEIGLKEYVFVQMADSVRLQEVQTGIQDDRYIQITKGLKAGEQVVVAPFDAISKKLEQGSIIEAVAEKELYKKTKEK